MSSCENKILKRHMVKSYFPTTHHIGRLVTELPSTICSWVRPFLMILNHGTASMEKGMNKGKLSCPLPPNQNTPRITIRAIRRLVSKKRAYFLTLLGYTEDANRFLE
ncbi:hypothetical protein AVEN_152842-1 [Araneus ventricosus]|nr:hypothetical protein AVEN_152842-1 [Araneus ventricosus]